MIFDIIFNIVGNFAAKAEKSSILDN